MSWALLSIWQSDRRSPSSAPVEKEASKSEREVTNVQLRVFEVEPEPPKEAPSLAERSTKVKESDSADSSSNSEGGPFGFSKFVAGGVGADNGVFTWGNGPTF